MATERSCLTCKHDPGKVKSIDDIPARCHSCIGLMNATQIKFPYWNPKDYVDDMEEY